MSYALLTSLYFGEGTNADLATPETRAALHVDTTLDTFIPAAFARGLDLVLTGNPGDGKSHLVRTLLDRGALPNAIVELDLSATPTADVLSRWAAAHRAGQRFVLCANEGPLLELLSEMSRTEHLADRAAEIRGQLGSLTVRRTSLLPLPPKQVAVIDLADRSVLDEDLVESALRRVCDHKFLPRAGTRGTETSAGRNLMLFAESERARRRLGVVLVHAGLRLNQHVSFRQLWAAISYAVTSAKKESTLSVELSQGKVGLGSFPLDHLVKGAGKGLLLNGVRRFGDPSFITDPALDEEIWTTGAPAEGRWFFDDAPPVVPARLWSAGDKTQALSAHASLKRLVALAHDAGERLVQRLRLGADLPQAHRDDTLKCLAIEGIRRLYLSPSEEVGAKDWLLTGLPLWIGHTYQDLPCEARPHVTVTALPEHDFEVLRPVRASWLDGALGPLPSVAWLSHTESGIDLLLDPDLIGALTLARASSGPMLVPEAVQRFLSRLAGWEEAQDAGVIHGDQLAVLSNPRGTLLACGATRELREGVFAYV